MRYLPLLSLLMLASCTTEHLLVDTSSDHLFSYALDESTTRVENPQNEKLYHRLIEEGYAKDEAYAESYSMNDIILERTLPGRCHKQYIKFRSVKAYHQADTLNLVFSTSQRRHSRASKLLLVKVYDGNYDVSLVHGSSLYIKVIHQDGSVTMEKNEVSHIATQTLRINDDSFTAGGVLKGHIAIKSSLDKGRRGIVKEKLHGDFRVVISDDHLESNKDVLGSVD